MTIPVVGKDAKQWKCSSDICGIVNWNNYFKELLANI